MKNRFTNAIALSLIPQIILVQWLAYYPEWVETYYSNRLYPVISGFFRILYGWLPISVGDLIYAVLCILVVGYLVLTKDKITSKPWEFLRKVAVVFSVTYFTFHLLWGFNYYRQPLYETMALPNTYEYHELLAFTERIIKKTNTAHGLIVADSVQAVTIPYTQKEIFDKTIRGYKNLERQFPFLSYEYPSIKKSVFSSMLSYMGYGGYLNPFTNEAQVNAKLPNFRFPVVCGHEMAHQLGYSAENETNFIGYLVTAKNPDPYFQYAAYAYAAGYCLAEIKRRDEEVFTQLYGKLDGGVQLNFEEMQEFWELYKNPLEPIFKSVFNTFLKANNQADGIESYNYVVSYLVSFHKENPL